MKQIIELPSGEVLEVRDDQFDLLRNDGLIIYVMTYMGNEINSYCYYGFHKQDIFDFLDRSGLDGFDDFIANRFGKVR